MFAGFLSVSEAGQETRGSRACESSEPTDSPDSSQGLGGGEPDGSGVTRPEGGDESGGHVDKSLGRVRGTLCRVPWTVPPFDD